MVLNFLKGINPNNNKKGNFGSALKKRGGSLSFIDPKSAMKSSDFYSSSAMDFINAGSNSGIDGYYNESQLLGAYLTSVYMFSALRRVANLISRVKIVAEVKRDNNYVRTPDSIKINEIFAKEGGQVLSHMWLNYAIFGAASVYKVKTRRAILQSKTGNEIFDYKDGALAGLYVLDKPYWDIDEDGTSGGIRGMYVNQYQTTDNVLPDKNYLDRREFVYVTDWNPMNPNRGKSIVATAIHEAVANAAIAQWMSEYFTRGAMPFIMVSMEDDPAMMTDSDLKKYKRQFEEYWQGIGSSLRSIFFDRSVKVEQVGIPADQVAAPELNETALEGISAAVGLDRELVVTPSGGSQERHEALVMRAWNDTVIPLAEKFLAAFNRDLGLPSDMRLVLDLSDIRELDADRAEKADTEMSIFTGGLQSYNDTLTRLKMKPVEAFDDWYTYNESTMPIGKILQTANIPHQTLQDYAFGLWDANLAKRSQVLELFGQKIPDGELDGYKNDIESASDLIRGLWGDDLLTRKQVLERLGFSVPDWADDGYKSELERGADYGEFITGLWSDNLLTRSQTIQLLDMGIALPSDSPDGYADEISNRRSNILELWDANLIEKSEAMNKLGLKLPEKAVDGFQGQIETYLENQSSLRDSIMEYWEKNLLTKEDTVDLLGLPKPVTITTGFKDEIEGKIKQKYEIPVDLWDKNLLKKSQVLESLGFVLPEEAPDGYQQQTDIINEALAEKLAEELTAEPEEEPMRSFVNRRNLIDEVPDIDDTNTWIDISSGIADAIIPKIDNDTITTTNDNKSVVSVDKEEIKDKIDVEVQRVEQEETNDVQNHADFLVNTRDDIVNSDTIDEIEKKLLEDLTKFDSDIDKIVETVANDQFDDMEEKEEVVSVITEWLNEPFNAKEDEEHNLTPLLTQNTTNRYASAQSKELDVEAAIENIQSINNEIDYSFRLHKSQSDESTNELYVSLIIPDNEQLRDAQKKIKQLYGNYEIEFQDPSTFHITVVYAPDVDSGLAQSVINILPDNYGLAQSLNVTGIKTFANNNGIIPVYAEIEKSDWLIQLQQKIVQAFNTYGIKLSEFTTLDMYNPHITLAYVKVNDTNPEITFKFESVVKPTMLNFGRDGYKYFSNFVFRNDLIADNVDYRSRMEKLEDYTYLNNMMRNNTKEKLRQYQNGLLEADELPIHLRSYVVNIKNWDEETIRNFNSAIDNGYFDADAAIEQDVPMLTLKKAAQKTITDEWSAWEKATIRSGIKKGLKFETRLIDRDITRTVKAALEVINPLDNEAVRQVFKVAKEMTPENKRFKRLDKTKIENWHKKFDAKKYLDFTDIDEGYEDAEDEGEE